MFYHERFSLWGSLLFILSLDDFSWIIVSVLVVVALWDRHDHSNREVFARKSFFLTLLGWLAFSKLIQKGKIARQPYPSNLVFHPWTPRTQTKHCMVTLYVSSLISLNSRRIRNMEMANKLIHLNSVKGAVLPSWKQQTAKGCALC